MKIFSLHQHIKLTIILERKRNPSKKQEGLLRSHSFISVIFFLFVSILLLKLVENEYYFLLYLISLSKFNLPLTGSFTWPMPPGPYRATTCRRRELNCWSQTYFFDHTRTWRTSPDEGSAQCRDHLRDNTNLKDGTHHSRAQLILTK